MLVLLLVEIDSFFQNCSMLVYICITRICFVRKHLRSSPQKYLFIQAFTVFHHGLFQLVKGSLIAFLFIVNSCGVCFHGMISDLILCRTVKWIIVFISLNCVRSHLSITL